MYRDWQLPSAYTCGAWRVEFRCSLRARFVGKRCAATDGPQLALLFYMLQGSLQKIDFQDLLPDLTFQLRDSRLLRPFLAYAGKTPAPQTYRHRGSSGTIPGGSLPSCAPLSPPVPPPAIVAPHPV